MLREFFENCLIAFLLTLKHLYRVLCRPPIRKIVVCGPPHSGKSVFVANIREMLPRWGFFLFRGAPDGEGTWSNKAAPETVKAVRKKGKFDWPFMRYVLGGLWRVTRHVPLTLVDVGGRRSKQNKWIFLLCDGFIVISSDEKETREWVRFGKCMGCTPVAILKSKLVGEEVLHPVESGSPVTGTITGLERGTYQLESSLLGALAARLRSLITFAAKHMKRQDQTMDKTIITVDDVAGRIGKGKETRPIRGKDITGYFWEGSDLKLLDQMLRPMSSTPGHYVLDGGVPPFFALAFCHGLHPQDVSLNDPRLGHVQILGKDPEGTGAGKGLKWTVKDAGPFVFVEYEIEGGVFDVADLSGVRVPVVPAGKGIVLSGKGPNWLTVTAAMSYHVTRWVGMWQPGTGATVAMTHHPERKLGDLIPDADVLVARAS